jgi:hypothetical protein
MPRLSMPTIEEDVEELRPDREPQNLGSIGLAGARLLGDLRLRDASRVEGLLHHDAAEARLGGLTGHGGAVVAAGGGGHARPTAADRLVDRQRGAAILEGAGGVGGLVLHEEARATTLCRHGADEVREVVQLDERGVAYGGAPLNAADVVRVAARLGEQAFVVEGDRPALVARVVYADGFTHDLREAGHHALVVGAGTHFDGSPRRCARIVRACSAAPLSSGTGAPKP